jgi:hypothetical protein
MRVTDAVAGRNLEHVADSVDVFSFRGDGRTADSVYQPLGKILRHVLRKG